MVEYSDEAGYPIGDQFSVKYLMIQIHFDNSKLLSSILNKYLLNYLLFIIYLDHYDNSGIRFYIGNKLRQYDLGYLTFGTHSSPNAIVIPPNINQFIIDSYCPIQASQVNIIIN